MPYGKLQSITSIKYTDSNGDTTTWSSSNYRADVESDPGKVYLGYNKSWPTATLRSSSAIEIIFVCGFGSSSSDVPSSIRQTMKMMINHMFLKREDPVPEKILERLAPWIIYS